MIPLVANEVSFRHDITPSGQRCLATIPKSIFLIGLGHIDFVVLKGKIRAVMYSGCHPFLNSQGFGLFFCTSPSISQLRW